MKSYSVWRGIYNGSFGITNFSNIIIDMKKNTSIIVVAIALVVGHVSGYLIAAKNPHAVETKSMADTMASMNAKLQGKTGDEFDKAFLNEMIMHHEGAIGMAQAAQTNAKHQEVKALAVAIISAQNKEITDMKAWLKSWYGIEHSMTTTSADGAPAGSIHNMPVPAGVDAARKALAQNLKVAENQIIIMSAFEKEWSDSCLGLGGAAESCAAVITPGYEVTMQATGKTYVYRTNAAGTAVREAK